MLDAYEIIFLTLQYDWFPAVNPLLVKGPRVPVVTQLFAMLRECVLSHRWEDALRLLTRLTLEDMAVTQQTLYRV